MLISSILRTDIAEGNGGQYALIVIVVVIVIAVVIVIVVVRVIVALLRSSGLPQALFFGKQILSLDFMTCIRLSGVFQAAAGTLFH